MFRLESNFKDYYDELSNDASPLVYRRFRQNKSRGEELKFLRNNGIRTVKIGPFRKFNRDVGKLVVYTNPSLHDFQGKHIYTFDEVACQYSNYIVSEFLEKYGGYTVKYLQVGKRRFRLMMFNPDYKTKLVEGQVVATEELPEQYNYAIGLPIYSIDYISNGDEMVAIDFNDVQNLQNIGMDKLMKAEDVATEIEKALLAYNKA